MRVQVGPGATFIRNISLPWGSPAPVELNFQEVQKDDIQAWSIIDDGLEIFEQVVIEAKG